MAITRSQCKQFVITHIADTQSVPPTWIKETTNLRSDLLWGSADYSRLAKAINRSNWHNAYFLPGELNGCDTPKEIIDLLYERAKQSA
jgi:hypothetical protein